MSDRDTLDRLRIAYAELDAECERLLNDLETAERALDAQTDFRKEIETLRYQRDGLRTAARELLARMDSSPERILLTAAIAASEDK